MRIARCRTGGISSLGRTSAVPRLHLGQSSATAWPYPSRTSPLYLACSSPASLARWAWRRLGVRPPKALFTIPSFHNPTTASASLAALRSVYAACAAHGVVIIEDDPYRMLAFGGEDPLAAEDAGAALPGTERAGLPPSFLSVDTDGRVVRCDTFSKWVSPGLRCGFVTAPRPLIVKLAQGAGPSLGVSSPVQVFLVEMLRRWGPAGLHRHVQRVQAAYRRRCAVALTAAAEHLSGLARWEAPRGGMFLWLELLGVRSSADLLDEMTRERVCVVPGAFFSAHETPPDTPFVRVSFAAAEEEAMVEGFRRLGNVLRRRREAGAAPAV